MGEGEGEREGEGDSWLSELPDLHLTFLLHSLAGTQVTEMPLGTSQSSLSPWPQSFQFQGAP